MVDCDAGPVTKIIDHIMTPAVVAGVVAYGAKLVDKDGDGVPDDYERKDE